MLRGRFFLWPYSNKFLFWFQFCGILGGALVPLSYMSTWLLCHSVTASLFASSFVLFGKFNTSCCMTNFTECSVPSRIYYTPISPGTSICKYNGVFVLNLF